MRLPCVLKEETWADGAGTQQWQRGESSVFTKRPSFAPMGCGAGARWYPESLSWAEVGMHMGHLSAGPCAAASQGLGLCQRLCRAKKG